VSDLSVSLQTLSENQNKKVYMLFTIVIILIILWLLGLLTSFTVGGFIHILLVIAIILVLLRVITGRRPL